MKESKLYLFFNSIFSAYEVLGSKEKRRSFDSVDPEFDDSVPSASQINKHNFYTLMTPIFERNARLVFAFNYTTVN